VNHRRVLVAWTATVTAFVTGILGGIVELVLLPHFAAMALAVVTLRRTERTGGLHYIWIYRASLVLLLLAATTCLVAAGSTVFIPTDVAGGRIAGFVTLASVNLVIAALAWRALVRPAPLRAAAVGAIAVFVETFAMLADIIGNHGGSGFSHASNIPIVLGASFAATWIGALVCMAALATFERSGTVVVPEARIVDET
jgi:hypothetical protein